MFSVETGFIETYVSAVGVTIDAFLPLIGATIGLFLAFAIANSLRFFIQKMAGRLR